MEPGLLSCHKVSCSTTNGGGCVEVAREMPGAVAVRGSKDPDGPVLAFTVDGWATFTARLRGTG